MHYPARAGRKARHTLCISSQAGCAVGCPFCATGELGFERDLETAEILDQVRSATHASTATSRTAVRRRARGSRTSCSWAWASRCSTSTASSRPSRRSTTRRSSASGARHITVSTSGVVPGIRRLTALGPQFTLAISLHAARNALRDVLVPLNRRWPVEEVVAAARDHARATGRRISYEMTMIGGVNDTDADADAVATLLRGDLAHVNLIPMNPVAHTPWQASPMPVIERFAARIEAAGIPVTIRRNRGAGDRGGMRPARRRAGRSAAVPAVALRRRAPRGRERPGPPRRAQRRAGAGRGRRVTQGRA